MKTLQKNFTTPEQSNRLLELGLPADSADCYYTWKLDHTTKINVLDNEIYSELLEHMSQFTIPCWSVGRLIKIIMLCHKQGILFFSSIRIYKTDILANTLIEYLIKYMPDMDFSKLEE